MPLTRVRSNGFGKHFFFKIHGSPVGNSIRFPFPYFPGSRPISVSQSQSVCLSAGVLSTEWLTCRSETSFINCGTVHVKDCTRRAVKKIYTKVDCSPVALCTYLHIDRLYLHIYSCIYKCTNSGAKIWRDFFFLTGVVS